jgi:hypothetical protein
MLQEEIVSVPDKIRKGVLHNVYEIPNSVLCSLVSLLSAGLHTTYQQYTKYKTNKIHI